MKMIEAVLANPVFDGLGECHVKVALISRGVDPCENYTESKKKVMQLVSADLYYDLATLPNFKEGQLAITYKSSFLLDRAKAIYIMYEDDKSKEFEAKDINLKVVF